MGAAYGTSKAGIGISGMGTLRPELIMKVRRPPRRLRRALWTVWGRR